MTDLLRFDLKTLRDYDYIAGIDEVGRGAFAGPIVACCVLYDLKTLTDKTNLSLLSQINDSKKLSSQKRTLLSDVIKTIAIFYGIKSITVEEINKLGIGSANIKVLENCIESLLKFKNKKMKILVDGNLSFSHFKNAKSLIQGDSLSLSIASASIIAKVYRDEYMTDLDKKYPEYGFAQNKGYGTSSHRNVIKTLGLTMEHRINWNLTK